MVCSARNGKEALEYLTQHSADVLFTDINMPVLNGLGLIEQTRQLDPRLTSVIISGYSEFEYARQAIRLGVKNYLLKPIDRAELCRILDTAAAEITQNAYAQKRSALIELLFCGNPRPAEGCAWKPLTVLYLCQGAVLGESRLLRSAPSADTKALSLADKSALRVAIQKQRWDDFTLQVQRIASHALEQSETQASLERLLTTILQMVLEETDAGTDREPEAVIRELVGTRDERQMLFRAFFDYCRDLFRHSVFDASDKTALMQSIAEYIQNHISEPLSLKQLSARFGLVAPYLSKLFKAYTGMSPAQYIQSIRIETAKRMLVEHPTMLSKDIAEQLGYSSPLYFSKTFFRNVGMYPSEYRSQHKKE